MKIKDLSSSNTINGEGMLTWNVVDTNGNQVSLQLPGYHIPHAEVRLLSPQVLLKRASGPSLQTTEKITISLGTGEMLNALYCLRTGLPCLQSAGHAEPTNLSFWTSTFEYDEVEIENEMAAYPNLLVTGNTNMMVGEKVLMLWHHRLSHAGIRWIQMCNRQWLRDCDSTDACFHRGPFLPCKTKAPTCNIHSLKCIACVCAKAHRRPIVPPSWTDQDKVHRFRSTLNSEKEKILKQGHTLPGDCISADHYLSPHQGCLYGTFGREREGYTCGTLFVGHASGKIFKFPQYSTTAAETVKSKRNLERLALEDGIMV